MNEETLATLATLGSIFFIIFGFLNVGVHFGAKEATNETTIECIEKPEKCKQRYEYLKLREKLGEY